jgi:hypothetical protein
VGQRRKAGTCTWTSLARIAKNATVSTARAAASAATSLLFAMLHFPNFRFVQ